MLREKPIKIRIEKNKYLYGKFSGNVHQPLFIVVHGLPGSMGESFYTDAVRWFGARGFATFRFDLYDWRKNARQLVDTTLKIHAQDFGAVVRYFRKKGFKKIFAAGHSYGGSTILLSHGEGLDGAALWDASYKISLKKLHGIPKAKYLKEIKAYMTMWGVNVVIGKRMADESETLPWDDLAKNFCAPIKIFVSGKGVLIRGARQYFKTAPGPKDLLVIQGATHYFDDTPDMQEKVFRLSESWFRKFLH